MPQVELWEAVALSCSIDPGSGPGFQRLFDFRNTLQSDTLSKFNSRLDIAEAHLLQGSLPAISRSDRRSQLCMAIVSLPLFAKWTQTTFSTDVPQEFSELAASAPMQEGIATPMQWPWGNHDTEGLRNLAAAAERFWKNYDSTDPTTAPTNQQVIDWLKAKGVATRTAEVIASILRADGLPTGPRR